MLQIKVNKDVKEKVGKEREKRTEEMHRRCALAKTMMVRS